MFLSGVARSDLLDAGGQKVVKVGQRRLIKKPKEPKGGKSTIIIKNYYEISEIQENARGYIRM